MKSRPNIRNRYVLIADLILVIVSVLGSYVLRLELGAAFSFYLPSAYWMIGTALVIKPLVYYYFRLYRRMWIYASVQELKLIVAAVSTASVVLSVVMVSFFNLGLFFGFPRSVLIIDWLVSLGLVGGLRFTIRLLSENATQQAFSPSAKTKKALIIGAGDAGALVVRELQKNPQVNLIPIGFLDDNPVKMKQQIHGIPVIGSLSDLAKVLDNRRVDEVIIAIPSAPGKVIRMVSDICRLKAVHFRTMPGIYELLGGKVSVNRLREVDITDLLRREPIRLMDEQIGRTISNRVVLVTGAGGSIGAELCRQLARWSPAELILLGHGENSIFEAYLELQDRFPSLSLKAVIADIRDKDRLARVFQAYRPQVVFHAAAHKHVPLMESNIEEAVTNNVEGTRNLVQAAIASDVDRLVMISTDKAIRPANVMGASKRLAEMTVLDAAERYGKDFSVVRFGNVLGSRGSVVPLFKRQIARGGPITITHPDMKRYFMTIPEAVYLVLQAATMGHGGETYVLNMGEQIRILDLAEDLIRLSGLEPGRDIDIIFTGIRPGEKLSEDLWDSGSAFERTPHPDIYQLRGNEDMRGEVLQKSIDEIINLAKDGDFSAVLGMMDDLIPGASVRSMPPPEMLSID
ncbi:MAG: polysaccharide biosynthesis protein [Chloroflexi bacterium]|nr:polysaccharide biosynthesis protein [Chloroflexota bacterium]BCY18512.1 polysaccharide biosynthesis protein CapD [Leptolinea sp. HRD-7]